MNELKTKIVINADTGQAVSSVNKTVDSLERLRKDASKRLGQIKAVEELRAGMDAMTTRLGDMRGAALAAGQAGAGAGERIRVGMAGARSGINQTTATMNAGMSSLSTQLANIQRAVIAYHSVMGALRAGSAIIQTADDFKSLQARLKLATGSIEGAGVALDDVRRIAAASGQDLSAVGTLYARLAAAMRDMGASQADTARVTEAVTLALRISGAGAAEASAATLQLSQAFASGVLRGDEFNSINEAAPRIMQALADHLGVTRGKLREMAEDGKLTSDVMSGSLLDSLQKLRAEASQLPDTMEQASTRIKNAWTELVVQFNLQTDASVMVSGTMNAMAANMDRVVGVAITLGEIVGVVLGARLFAAVRAANVAGTALGALGVVAGGALRLLGGWPGLLLSLGVAAYGFYKDWQTAEDNLTAARAKSAAALGDMIAVNSQYADTQVRSAEVVRALGDAEVKRYHEAIQGAIAYYNGLYEQEARLGDAANPELLKRLAAQRDAYIKANADLRPIYQ